MFGFTTEQIEVIKAIKIIKNYCKIIGCGPCPIVDDWDECIMKKKPKNWILPESWEVIE